ncbi:MAG: hypothetical protein WC641_08305 [Patescibacteria group bacterium]
MSRGLDTLKSWHYGWLILAIALAAVAWASHDLLDSPRPWFDEGIYLQAAKNIALTGHWGLQIAPGSFSDLSFITVGFPVLAPLVLIFKFAGSSLLAARLYMLVWIALGIWLAGMVGAKLWNRAAGVWSAALLATFGPWYGNGKNVMGEVPGLALFLAGIFSLAQWEEKPDSKRWACATALFFCLAAVTKPSFLVVLPALFLAACFIFWKRYCHPRESGDLGRTLSDSRFCENDKEESGNDKKKSGNEQGGGSVNYGEMWKLGAALLLPALLVFAVWFLTQFGGWPSAQVLGHYSNPYGLSDVAATMLTNFKNFFLHTTPLHLLILLSAVAIYVVLRGWKKMKATELALLVVMALTLASYFRTAGWYRYFFVAQVLALFWLPACIQTFAEKLRPASKMLAPFVLLLFLGVNLFALWRDPSPLYGRNWREVETYLKSVPDQTWFFANAPEAAFFYPGADYGQYLRITDRLKIGQPAFGTPPPANVVTEGDLPEMQSALTGYRLEKTLGDYRIWSRPPGSTGRP